MSKLQPGDVLVFKAGNDWNGKSIAWLTDSDVSHAAMMLEDGHMVEMGADGISAKPVEAREGDNAFWIRMLPEKDAAPLAAAAQRYIDCKTRYDFPALVFLAGLIIYRKIRPTPKLVNIVDIIIRATCVALDKMIQILLKNPDKAMVCSQLVYQVYEDCGKEYHIEIENGLLQAASELDASDSVICLADLAANAPEPDMVFASDSVFADDEELARELYLALENAEQDMSFVTANLGALPSWAKRFLEKLDEFLEKSKSNIPIDALFITPADLAYKSKNMETVCKLEIIRREAL